MFCTETHALLHRILHQQEATNQQLTRMEHTMASQQDQVNALTDQVLAQKDQFTALGAALAGIQSDIDTLIAGQQAGTPADLTGLQSAVADLVTTLGAQVAQATAIDAENPVPPPA
jgi:septal ring factor EnvC (AmiA/AmiB activator)